MMLLILKHDVHFLALRTSIDRTARWCMKLPPRDRFLFKNQVNRRLCAIRTLGFPNGLIRTGFSVLHGMAVV